MPKTLLDKLWEAHLVLEEPGCPAILYVDLHLVHEVTSPQAFEGLRQRGLKVRQPTKTVATMDHLTPTRGGLAALDAEGLRMVTALERGAAELGIPLYRLGEPGNGIVHVIGPELGLTLPGMTIVCGDSHTSTHGAFGALAFGIGSSEVEHVLATQCLLQRKPKAFEVRVDGRLAPGVFAKDLALAVIARLGSAGGTGCVLEYRGPAISGLTMEARMTLCNLSIEAGARAGLIAPDDETWRFLRERPLAPKGAAFDRAVEASAALMSDEGAEFPGGSLVLDAGGVEPMITWGTNPSMGMPIAGAVPRPEELANEGARKAAEKALMYMGLQAGEALLGKPIDVVFIGSCTNSRLSDLEAAAHVLKGRKVKRGVRMLVVPGSVEVKRLAEARGLDRVFEDAGAEWRDAGCSMCIAMNGDTATAGQYVVSTSNRNFEGRQGTGARTLLASPATAAACAIAGAVADPRERFIA